MNSLISAITMPAMTPLTIAALALVAVASLYAMLRTAMQRTHSGASRALSAALQLGAALAFALMLAPPLSTLRMDAITVLTPGASDAQLDALPRTQSLIVLPGSERVSLPSGAEYAPDLATALRRHRSAQRIDVVGAGLPPRDLDATRGRSLHFDAAPPFGIMALDAAPRARAGTQWRLRGRVAPGVRQVLLRDPAGQIVDRATPAADGGFVASTAARAPGLATFMLQAADSEQTVVDRVSVAVVIESGAALTLRIRAAGPDPDQKYWRRWARDAGATVGASVGLSDQIALRDGDAALDAAMLAATDLLLLDERSWAQLSSDEQASVLTAVEQGMGLLLRVTGAVDDVVAAQWRALGLPLEPQPQLRSVALDQTLGLREPLPLTAAPASLTDGASAWLRSDAGETLAAWTARGAGRIGAWLLIDSYRLGLQGEGGHYAALWSDAVATLARPQVQPTPPPLPMRAWVDERSQLCDLPEDAQLLDPQRQPLPLLIVQGCAALWPAQPGWYALKLGGRDWPFPVLAADDGRGLRAARDAEATRALAAGEGDPGPSAGADAPAEAPIKLPLPRWPFAATWLLLTALLWWRERRDLQAG